MNSPSNPNSFQFISIQCKIVLWAGICLFITSAIITTYTSFRIYETARQAAEQEAAAIANRQALRIGNRIEEALYTSQALAEALSAMKAENPLRMNRKQVSRMIKEITVDNSHFIGSYTLWEPDAFDGKDTQFVNQHPYDSTGRFGFYWNRNEQGEVQAETLLDYEATDSGAYYQCPKQTHKPCIIDPFIYPVQGENVLMTSIVVPIIADETFYGIVGVDINVDFFQDQLAQIPIYDGAGTITLIAHEGTIVATTKQSDLAGKDIQMLHPEISSPERLAQLWQGDDVWNRYRNETLEVFAPVQFGDLDNAWIVNINIPRDAIAAEARELLLHLIGMGALLTVGALFLLWVIAGQIARPIHQLTVAARQISDGNMDTTVQIITKDEIGILAHVFNDMVTNIRQLMDNEREAKEAIAQAREKVIEAQQATLYELSAPLLPISDHAVVMPLIGTVDTRRVQQIMETLLNGVAYHRARVVIIDITGVKTVDTQVANALVQAAYAVRLLGARVVITGIKSDVAQTLVQLGADLSGIETRGNLQNGIAYAINGTY